LLVRQGRGIRKFRQALPFTGSAPGALSEQRRFEWLT
jgi:hypothetical protein